MKLGTWHLTQRLVTVCSASVTARFLPIAQFYRGWDEVTARGTLGAASSLVSIPTSGATAETPPQIAANLPIFHRNSAEILCADLRLVTVNYG
ncbi:MAG: hypothetical protein C5B50_03605 [Verrucomicrobia bacterium]|nr:MAG: hypothetical protein C5B50_03605 [Verrucomicrobiota bacterium]